MTLALEMLNPVVAGATVIPVPLTHNPLPGAPSVKLTPAHYRQRNWTKRVISRAIPDTEYRQGVGQPLE
jgi:hypothetical protein